MELDELALYSLLALEARKQLIELLFEQESSIRKNNLNAIRKLTKEIKVNPNVLNNIDNHLRNTEENIREGLRKEIDSGLILSVEAGMYESKQTTLSILNKTDIDWKPIERSFFRVHNEAVDYMHIRNIQGLNLSDRIWEKGRLVRNDIGAVIQEAIREGLNPTDIAELLDRYANDGAKTFAVQYPNMFERLSVAMDMNYESLRLARTEMAAAFGHASVESAKINPAIQGIKWSISNAGVTCDVCLDISKHESGMGPGVYAPDDLPDYPAHPNCLCVLSEVTEDIDDLVERLIEWNKNPLSQPDIEKWYRDNRINAGNGLRTNNSDDAKVNSIPELLGKLSYSDREDIINELNKYEKVIVNDSIENAYVVLSNGETYKFTGNEYSVDPTALGNKLKGSFITHNHPKNQTYHSFSADDISLFLNKELEVLRGIDDRFVYQMTRTKDTIKESKDNINYAFKDEGISKAYEKAFKGEIDMDLDSYHEAVKALSKKYKFNYKRWLNE